MKLGIIITPERTRTKIVKALREFSIDYDFINLLEDNWEKSFIDISYDGYLIYPPAFPDEWQSLFYKRLYLVRHRLKGNSVPNLDSIMMYESKITMHDFYKIHNLPHIETHTFYDYKKALNYGRLCRMPVVVKENSGSGAIGVKVIKNRSQLLRLIRKSFFINNRIRRLDGFKSILKSLKTKFYPYKIFIDSNMKYLPKNKKTSGVIHIQSHLKIKHEWRIIRIGDSFFGHKKLADKNGFHSGSLNKEWGPVNIELLDLVRNWSDKLALKNMCFDIFEDFSGNYFINELQVMFGTSTEEQLKINGKAGRYIYNREKNWVFEEGDFSRNGCNNLRIELLLSILENNIKNC